MRAPTFETLDEMVVDAPVVYPDYHVNFDDPPPPHQLVASHDIVRTDQFGRRAVLVPKGQPPESRVRLTEEEEATLVEPPPSPKDGLEHTPIHGGYTRQNVTMGEY
jgi:hypothetical protein